MSGRHLRRRRGATVLGVLLVLSLGVALGAGGSLVLDDRDEEVAVDGSAALTPDPGPITIALAGDVLAGGALVGRLDAGDEDFVGPLAPVLRDADLAVVNLDAPLTVDGTSTGRGGAAPTSLLGALAAGGVDVVSVANDRSLDLGAETLGAVSPAAAVALVGFGQDEASAYRPFVREVGGHTVAVVAATQVLEPDRIASDTAGPQQPGVASAKRIDRLVAEVEAARAVADTVVAYLHWGTAGETCPSTSQQELAAALVVAGADVIAGPGAGRVQGAGRAGGAAVAFGLGRFLADDTDDDESGVLLVEVDGREVLGIGWVPARRTDGVPQPLTGAEAREAIAGWESRRDCTGLTP